MVSHDQKADALEVHARRVLCHDCPSCSHCLSLSSDAIFESFNFGCSCLRADTAFLGHLKTSSMPPISIEVSKEDIPYLEELAELDTISDSSTVPDDACSNEFELDENDDDLFDSFIATDDALSEVEDNTEQRTTSEELYPVLNLPSSPLHSSQFAIRLKSETNEDASVKPEAPRTIANSVTASQTSQSGIKRAASAQELRSSQEGQKPAKLNKSFSEGLDETLNDLHIQTDPHPSGAIITTNTLSLTSTQLSAELAIERELGSIQYQVPLKTLLQERKKNAGKSKPVSFWSHLLYQDVDGNRVKVKYCKTKEQSEAAAALMLSEKVLGFDMEWLSTSKQSPNLTGLKREICTIQAACEDLIVVFHVALHAGETVDDLIAPSLRKIIESRTIMKAGNCIFRADAKRLKKYFSIQARGLVELSQLHQVVINANRGSGCVRNTYHNLANLVETYLELPMFKGNTRTSDWGKPLNERQILYAAADAYAGYMLYRVLDGKRMSQSPIPPRPAFAELTIPLSNQIDAWHEERTKAGESALDDESGSEESEIPRAEADFENSTKVDVDRAPKDIILDVKETQVFEALRKHRSNVSQSNKISLGFIAGESILRNLAVQRPTNLIALQTLPGIGPHRAKTYGKDWLRIIQEHDHLWMVPPVSLPNDFAQREVATYNRLLSALQRLRSELGRDHESHGVPLESSLPADDVLDRLARVKPVSSAALRCIPGAESFNALARSQGIDLLVYIKQEVQDLFGGQPQSKKAVVIPEQDDSDSDCFEVMDVSRFSHRS